MKEGGRGRRTAAHQPCWGLGERLTDLAPGPSSLPFSLLSFPPSPPSFSLSGGMTLFGRREGCWRYINMAREPKLSHTRPGQKRQHTGSLYPIYEYQKIPPLIGHIPIKTRRSHLGAESKTRLRSLTDLTSNSNPTTGRTKLRAEELHSIKGELSQIKAQVDNLLESLNRMDQQREHPTGTKESKRKLFAGLDASSPAGELIRMKDSVKSEGPAPQQETADSAEESTDTEEANNAVRNHTPDPEGSK
ncbi:RNA-binding Raly-like protein isoform X2 [Erythrolamprus reginae]|uniref:RNA-binding Raly-like protein isoform X2 n=1 Tax=Erythrolamprus reginae TaxID=121349 RepID=UPI00396C43A7